MREHREGIEHRENIRRDSHFEHSPIVDLGMSDTEYVQALAVGRDPRQEQVYEHSLITEGVEVAEAKAVAPLIDKYPRLPEEQAIVTNVWRKLVATPNVTENSVLPLDTDGDGSGDLEELTISSNSGRTDSIQPSQQQAVSHAVQPELGAAQVAQKMLSKLPSCQTRQFLTALTRELSKRSLEAVVAIASLPQWKRERDVANTAQKLLHHNSLQTGENFYHAEKYTVKLDGNGDYTISDNLGQELMRFQAGGLTGPRILTHRMSQLQYQDFTQAQKQIQRLGGVNGISQDPFQRLKELGNLAPFGNRELVYATKIKQVVQTARDYLRAMGVSSLQAGQQGNYSMEAKGDDYLRIEEHSSGKGTVLEIENGTLKSDLSAKDFSHFQHLHNLIQTQASTTVEKQPVVKKASAEIFVNNSQLRNVAAVITAKNVLDSLGTNTYEGDSYRFERLGDAITLTAKDGRGEIARMEAGHVTGQLSNLDAVFLSQMNRAVMPQLLQSSEFPMATTQTQARLTLLSQTAPNESLTRAKDIELGE